MKRIIIVGGGIAGLSFAYECLLRKHQVMIVEAAAEVGGLAKSIYHNRCFLDIGVHVMYLKDPEVFAKVKEVVDSRYFVKVQRNGKLYLQGKYIDWPLTYKALFQFPFTTGLNIVLDQFRKKKHTKHSLSYKTELLRLYGPTLYYSFFHPLTQKFLHIDPKYIHSDWAFASLRAATKIEDKSFRTSKKYQNTRIDHEAKKDFDIFKFLATSLLTKKKDEQFYYFRDGFGMLAKAYEKRILALGGVIKTQTTVEKFIMRNKTVQHCLIAKQKYPADTVVWAANPFALCKVIGIRSPSLPFLHSKYLYVFLKRCRKDYQVCYYADRDVSFIRASIFSHHSKTVIRNPHVAAILCLEYSSLSPEELFAPSDLLKKRAIKDLIRVGVIETEGDIESMFEIHVPRSYPILTIDYREKVAALQKLLSGYSNIIPLGRQATFQYNNSDIIIKETLSHPAFQTIL